MCGMAFIGFDKAGLLVIRLRRLRKFGYLAGEDGIMDIVNVSRFLAVIEAKSFAGASKSFGVTPQAIAFSIAKLEAELGVKLFQRESGGVTTPTEYALALEAHARNLVVNERSAYKAIQSLREAETGWLRLGVGETMTGSTIAQLISDMCAERPDVNIAIIENYTDRLITRMKLGEIDLIAGAPITNIDHADSLHQHVLFESTDIVVARSRHPLVGKKDVGLEDMQQYPWVVPYARRDAHDAIVKAFLNANLDPPKSFLFSDAPTLGQALIQSRDYLFLSPPDMAHLEPGGGMARVFAIEPTLTRSACLIYPNDRPLSNLAKVARDKILNTKTWHQHTGAT